MQVKILARLPDLSPMIDIELYSYLKSPLEAGYQRKEKKLLLVKMKKT